MGLNQCFFDTRMIDFREKKGSGRIDFWEESDEIDDQLSTGYDEAVSLLIVSTLRGNDPDTDLTDRSYESMYDPSPSRSSCSTSGHRGYQRNYLRLRGSSQTGRDQRLASQAS